MRTLIIMRGIPGSGKSTEALQIQADLEDTYTRPVRICSADNFFLTADEHYHFDPAKLRQAHDYCWSDFKNIVVNTDVESIIIDNTNTKLWEFKKYLGFVKGRNFVVRVLRCEAPLDVCQKRNVHGVPADKIQQMRDRFEDFPGEEIINAF